MEQIAWGNIKKMDMGCIFYEEDDVKKSVKKLKELLVCAFEYPDDRFIETVIDRIFGVGFVSSEENDA
ncbi:MAG: hypothetical protein KAR35_06140 [Candidatus Heimdallarchaeota archaeon]|nr:hypothetical protein [Candidatus Heimdallarchaeota archaeon]MCK5048939.1 hypothetical protein [Candidatus Heimdallarchaeota archaeon]